MSEKNWFCTTCSAGFTRKYGAERHIRHIHSGQAKKARRIDYIIGRLLGEFSPADPLAYRLRMRDSSKSSSNRYGHEDIRSFTQTIGDPSYVRGKKKGFKEDIGNVGSYDSGRHAAGGLTPYERADRPNRERGKCNTEGFPITSPRLEEVTKIIMSFSTPGKNPPPLVQQRLLNLSYRILERGGDDSFLEQPLKYIRSWVGKLSALDESKQLLNPEAQTGSVSESAIQEQSLFPSTSFKKLPQDANADLANIWDTLIPFYPPKLIHYKLNELVTDYQRTGDSTLFKKALVHYLNRPPEKFLPKA